MSLILKSLGNNIQFMKIGFIGLGRMGSRMAMNLLKRFREINVYNRTYEKAKPLLNAGAKFFKSPKELAKNSDCIITMLRDSNAVKWALLSEEGAFNGANKGSYFIDMSTIQPKVSIELAMEASKRGFHFIDAPVIGSIDQAAEGTLTIVCGGAKEDFEKVLPILQAMGKNIFYVGPSGSGSKLKLINNTLIANFPAIFSEIITIAKRAGLDEKITLDVLKSGIFGKAIEYYEKRVVGKDFTTRFALDLMLKDIKYARELAEDFDAKPYILSKLEELYEAAWNKGWKDLDYTAIALLYEDC
ncbi:MAG: NAD(P)-dependent oxidoreductase [Thermoproteota archaeon]|jgi:3-hydroxyisobutyrate dehydrogenase-like beta-hydroxyacid dehydrogenase|nr:NAD(P)-dependent oxidoreductase [Thermoproteota archaeon]